MEDCPTDNPNSFGNSGEDKSSLSDENWLWGGPLRRVTVESWKEVDVEKVKELWAQQEKYIEQVKK